MSIEKASWGKGFATEALSAVLHYLADEEKIAAKIIEEEDAATEEAAETPEDGFALAIIPENEPVIRDLIYTVRGTQVMLDSDLAALYGVETKVLNQAVTRNPKRFPEHFCFRVSRDEAEDLRSQIVTLHPEQEKQDFWWRYMPRAFTEQGLFEFLNNPCYSISSVTRANAPEAAWLQGLYCDNPG